MWIQHISDQKSKALQTLCQSIVAKADVATQLLAKGKQEVISQMSQAKGKSILGWWKAVWDGGETTSATKVKTNQQSYYLK